ncbi:MAG: aminotransferase class V-fold PLP-dependent enzyme [Deltaproteobacteria bacterium]|nr:aminotransferase class V-fold PLP-dependent enzyme [Deltaproteobacteria bacterium]
MKRRSPNPFARYWILDSRVDFLNHGSFGACPKVVLAKQSVLRARMERQPVQFLDRDLEGLLGDARAALGRFIGADPDDLAFLPNATAGVNTVLRSLKFKRGDELLTANMEYNACRNALYFAARGAGARVVEAKVPFPISSPDDVVDAVLSRVSKRTRLALVSHITSPTALVFPIKKIVKELDRLGVQTLVDGAHAPGMVPLEIEKIGAAYYTGNCHKWLCAPKGAGFLHVRRDLQKHIRPLSISHGANSKRTDRSRFRIESDWTGTDDPTAYLCVPEAIRFLGSLVPGGWKEVKARNHGLAVEARKALCAALKITPPCPESMLGSMASVALPQAAGGGRWAAVNSGGRPIRPTAYSLQPTASGLRPRSVNIDPLQDILYEQYGIEPVVFAWPTPEHKMLRVSAQLYNSREQYVRLARALADLLECGGPPSPKRLGTL